MQHNQTTLVASSNPKQGSALERLYHICCNSEDQVRLVQEFIGRLDGSAVATPIKESPRDVPPSIEDRLNFIEQKQAHLNELFSAITARF